MFELRPAAGPRLVIQLAAAGDQTADTYEVRVSDSPAGESAAERITLPPPDAVMAQVQDPSERVTVGQQLFEALFPGEVGQVYRAVLADAALNDQRLALELRFPRDLTAAARYPWELIHDSNRFLLQAGAVNLARYLMFPEPPRILAAETPLDLLVISANPQNAPPLELEFSALEKSFRALIDRAQIRLTRLLPPTWDAMMAWLITGQPGVLHFEGHGAFTEHGLLVFETADGEADPVDAATMAAALYGTRLRLAFLSACQSAQAGRETLLNAVAPSLILAGIPAVIAMQQTLPDTDAFLFARGFYEALLAGHDLETAAALARKTLLRTASWHVPTLYLRARRDSGPEHVWIDRRVDTAGPRAAPVDRPTRVGLWVRCVDSPSPGDEELRRLLGLVSDQDVQRTETPARVQFPVELGEIQPGEVEVELIAPGCEFHTSPVKTITVFADFDTPPLLFPITPHEAEWISLIFELRQNGRVIGSIAHAMEIVARATEPARAAVQSHYAGETPHTALKPAPAPALPPDVIDDLAGVGWSHVGTSGDEPYAPDYRRERDEPEADAEPMPPADEPAYTVEDEETGALPDLDAEPELTVDADLDLDLDLDDVLSSRDVPDDAGWVDLETELELVAGPAVQAVAAGYTRLEQQVREMTPLVELTEILNAPRRARRDAAILQRGVRLLERSYARLGSQLESRGLMRRMLAPYEQMGELLSQERQRGSAEVLRLQVEQLLRAWEGLLADIDRRRAQIRQLAQELSAPDDAIMTALATDLHHMEQRAIDLQREVEAARHQVTIFQARRREYMQLEAAVTAELQRVRRRIGMWLALAALVVILVAALIAGVVWVLAG